MDVPTVKPFRTVRKLSSRLGRKLRWVKSKSSTERPGTSGGIQPENPSYRRSFSDTSTVVSTWDSEVIDLPDQEMKARCDSNTTTITCLLGDDSECTHEDPECLICLEIMDVNDDECQALPCGHTFHSSCVDDWRRRRQTCPTCRQSLVHTIMHC